MARCWSMVVLATEARKVSVEVRQKWVQGLEVLHLFRCLFNSLLLESFCTKVAAGILRPGILRPFHVHFDHPRAAFLVQRLKYV